MKLVDVHCHLDHPYFKTNLEQVLERAKRAGLVAIITAGVNPASNRVSLELAKKHDIVKAAIGIYPPDALAREMKSENKIDFEKELKFIEENKDKIAAIGEIGLDFASPETDKELQKDIFEKQLALAKKLGLLVVVHSRNAEEDVLDILEKQKMKKVCLHFFSGKKKLIEKASRLGFYFSIPANIVRSLHFQNLVQAVDIKQLLTETDSPFAAPNPNERNEPANVIFCIEKIAEIKGLSKDDVAEQIYKNFKKVFQLM